MVEVQRIGEVNKGKIVEIVVLRGAYVARVVGNIKLEDGKDMTEVALLEEFKDGRYKIGNLPIGNRINFAQNREVRILDVKL